jgi:hypothetical protein
VGLFRESEQLIPLASRWEPEKLSICGLIEGHPLTTHFESLKLAHCNANWIGYPRSGQRLQF